MDVPNLKKRPASQAKPMFARTGHKIADDGPVRIGEWVTVYVESGDGLRLRVDDVREDGSLLGRVEQFVTNAPLTHEISGVRRGDNGRIPSSEYGWGGDRS